MSEQGALAFHKLVGAMRTTEKEYWAHRDKQVLRQAFELEGRVDDTIAKVDAKNVPESKNGEFFKEVALLRSTTKEYFSLKKSETGDKEVIKEKFKMIKASEAKVDKMLVAFQDEQALKDGYRIEWHVMEKLPRAHEAHPIFNSMDEQLARIELNNFMRRPPIPGTMYFMAKKYIKPQEKK